MNKFLRPRLSDGLACSDKKRSPSALTAQYLRENGYIADKVEQVLPGTWIKKDLFGFGDYLGMKIGERGSTIFQPTSTDNISHRRVKILENAKALMWLQCGNRIAIHGWELRGGVWHLAVQPLTLKDFIV